MRSNAACFDIRYQGGLFLSEKEERLMKAAYLKAKYQFEVRDVELREPDRNEGSRCQSLWFLWA